MLQQRKEGNEALRLLEENLALYRERVKGVEYEVAEAHIIKSVKLLRVEKDGTVVWELSLPSQYHHVGRGLHGGYAALILDQLSSLSVAPYTHIGNWSGNGGVTRTFVVTCLRPAKIDATVQIRCKVINIGKTSLLLHASIVSPDGKYIYNTMEHNKVNVILKKPVSGKL
ncbi:hypothetical protein GQ44DRAFT_778289 [Phaeosphaeriaceae sp. PMI808]|nr:hypothetical protein GQ44DRAFT_778289 [Phaeosphaeriaceae sp. PMI808]